MPVSGDHPHAHLRPLWRFTWRGWVLLAIALSLAALALSGYDANHRALQLLNDAGVELIGNDRFFLVMLKLTDSNWFLHRPWPTMDFDLTVVMVTLVAIGLHGRKNAVVWAVALVAAELALDVAVGLLFSMAGRRGPAWIPVPVRAHMITIAITLQYLSWVVILWALTRSWRRAAALAAITLGALCVQLNSGSILPRQDLVLFGIPVGRFVFPALAWAWFLAVAWVLIGWGLQARYPRPNPGRCHACAYDRRGLSPDAPCPECGAAAPRPAAHAPATPATDPPPAL